MAYQKTNWVNDQTPLNATNMNHIEDGIATLDQNKAEKGYLDDNFVSKTYLEENYFTAEDEPTPGSIPRRRSTTGAVVTGSAVEDNDAVPLQQLQSMLADIILDIGGSTSRLIGATQSLSMVANTYYICTDALTSLIVSSFTTDVGNPLWEIKFKTGSTFTANFPNSMNWVTGTPVFEANTEYTIYAEECIEVGKYDAYVVEK